MFERNRRARINVKLVIILMLVIVSLVISLVAARQIRRVILSQQALTAGHAAYEAEDWKEASKQLQEYLGRNPDDVEILKKYAKARMAIRPVEAPNVGQAISAYRRVLQLESHDEEVYDGLAKLYLAIGNNEELAYIARMKLDHDPNDLQAPLWLAEGLIRLNKAQEAQQTLEKFIRGLEALPDKHDEYVRACGLMSRVVVSDEALGAKAKALEWLDKAVDYRPDSVEALANRARFLRVTADLAGLSDEERRTRARKDLEAADELGTEDPTLRFFLCEEWMAHGELEQAGVELHAAENLPQEALEEHFFDIKDWTVRRFLLASELTLRQGAAIEDANLADVALDELTEQRHRAQVLPSAVRLYVATDKVSKARESLDEYIEILQSQQAAAQSRVWLAYLRALVADAEEKYYDVIDILQPVVVTEASTAEFWGLLAEAYTRTGQSSRAITAMQGFLRARPGDPGMTLQLASEYSRLRDWKNAFEAAERAESFDPTQIDASLLRIEAGIRLAVEQAAGADLAKLEAFSAELAQLLQKHADRNEINRLQAVIATYLDKPDQTEQELKRAIERSKDALGARIQLVAHYRQNGKMAEAMEECQKACELHPGVARPWLSLSELHMANEDYDAASACLQEGLGKVVSQEEKQAVSIRLAILEFNQGDQTEGKGKDRLMKLVDDDPQEVRARSLLLLLREVREDPNQAETLIRQLRVAEGESGILWRVHQASFWLSSDDWRQKQQDIVELLQYCIDADPLWLPPVLLLVNMYERLGDFKRVEDICRRTLARNPSAATIADRLLRLLESQERFSEAEQVLQQVQADTRLTSAWQVRAAVGAGDLSRAIDELKLKISDGDQDALSRIQLAQLIYQETKDTDEAFRYLKEAESITSDSMALMRAKVSILKADGQTEKARQILDDYVADHNDFNAYWMRAVLLAEAGESERAEQDYQKLTTFTEQATAGYILLSNFYATNEKLDKAVKTLEEGLKAYPENLGLMRNKMQLLFRRNQGEDQEKALEILTALEEELPEDVGLMQLRAMLLLQEQDPQSRQTAKEKLETVVELAPKTVDAHLLLVGMAMEEGDFRNAREDVIRAIGSNPNNPRLLSARSRVELGLENTQLAIHLAQQALEEDPNNIAAMVVLADAYRLTSDMDQSEQWIERAERLDPNNQAVFEARYLWLGSQKRFKELTEISSTFLSSKEQDLRRVSIVATILSRADSMEFKREAVKLFEHALNLSPTAIGTKLNLASTLYQIGNAQRAKAIYRELLEQHPDNIRALNDLAWILQEHDHRYEAALELANKGLKIAPDNLNLLDTRGTILLNMEDRLADARTDFEKLEQLSPPESLRQARTLLKLGRICVRLDDNNRAKEYLEKALEIDRKLDIFNEDERSEITGMLR